ncbi:ionotropic receptor 21a-like [Drosophila navojoa]|nr:ionotropic receptor 21a-like [Drosophila navojoa]
MIMIAQESGLMIKLGHEVSWAMQRSATGRLLQASTTSSLREIIQEERQLTTADTEGMFLLMGIGYLMGAIALVSEIVGGITNKCRQIIKRSRKSASSTWSSQHSSAVVRTTAEQQAHDVRKAARRHAAEDANQRMGFGMREFNLTRTTLRELYNANRSETQPLQLCDSHPLDAAPFSSITINEVPSEVYDTLDGLDQFIARLELADGQQNTELSESDISNGGLDIEPEHHID